MDKLESNIEREVLRFNLSLKWLLSIALYWSYLIHDYKLPLRQTGILLVIALCFWVLENKLGDPKFLVVLKLKHFLFYLASLGLLLIAHSPLLFMSLAGDEMFHAQKSGFLISKLSDKLQPFLEIPSQVYGYRALNLSLMPVQDLWRLLSTLVIIPGLVLLFRFLSLTESLPTGSQKRSRRLAALFFMTAVAYWVGTYVDHHPPLRIVPLFFSELLFGYNEFAVRLPGVMTQTLMISYLFFKLSTSSKNYVRAALLAFAAFMSPQVFHVASAVEVNIYALLFWCAILLFVKTGVEKESEQHFIWAGIIATIGILFRPTVVIPAMGIAVGLLLCRRYRFQVMTWIKSLGWILLAVPYLSEAQKNNPIYTVPVPLSEKLHALLGVEVPLTTFLHSTTLWWFVVVSAVVLFLWNQRSRVENILIVLFIPFSLIYFLLCPPSFWMPGRYQAEFWGALIALVILFSGRRLLNLRVTALLAIALITSSFEIVHKIDDDMNNNGWVQMRVTISSNFPYNDALRFVHRHEAARRFVLLGGTDFNIEPVLWINGFSLAESEIAKKAVVDFDSSSSKELVLKDAIEFFNQNKTRFILVQSGLKREYAMRTESQSRLIAELEKEASRYESPFRKVRSFTDYYGAIIDVFEYSPQ